MNIERDLPIILILGTIGLYFLVTGMIGLTRKRMTILNPRSETKPLTILDAAISILKKKVEADYYVPEDYIDQSKEMELRGKDVLVRAWFYIFLGLVSLFILIAFLIPEIPYKIMQLFINLPL